MSEHELVSDEQVRELAVFYDRLAATNSWVEIPALLDTAAALRELLTLRAAPESEARPVSRPELLATASEILHRAEAERLPPERASGDAGGDGGEGLTREGAELLLASYDNAIQRGQSYYNDDGSRRVAREVCDANKATLKRITKEIIDRLAARPVPAPRPECMSELGAAVRTFALRWGRHTTHCATCNNPGRENVCDCGFLREREGLVKAVRDAEDAAVPRPEPLTEAHRRFVDAVRADPNTVGRGINERLIAIIDRLASVERPIVGLTREHANAVRTALSIAMGTVYLRAEEQRLCREVAAYIERLASGDRHVLGSEGERA